nr:ubiquitin hydrolase [Tanacetum cinerariifolium]
MLVKIFPISLKNLLMLRNLLMSHWLRKLVLDDKLEKKTVVPTDAKIEFVKVKQEVKPVRKPVKYAEMYKSQGPTGNQINWNNLKSQQLGSNFAMYNKACFVCGSFKHVQGRMNEEETFGVNDLDGNEVIMNATAGEEVEQSTKVAKIEVSIVDPVTTTGEVVTTAEDVEVTTAATNLQISKDELLLAQTLIEIKATKPKARGVIIQEPRKSIFARLRAEEKRRKPPTKTQKRKIMSTYLKNMAGFTHNQLKNKSFEELQKAFDNTMSWINSFVPMEKDRAKGSETIAERSSKEEGEELKSDKSKKQKLDEQVEAEVYNDQREVEMKMYMKIIPNDEIEVDAIPLAIKPPIIVD